MLAPERYPLLTEFMEKCLFQLAAESFDDCISSYTQNGVAAVSGLVAEINDALAENHEESELAAYIQRHSDYFLETAIGTLVHIRTVLQSWLTQHAIN